MFRVAIVGCGYITQAEHLPNWRQIPGVEVVGLVDQRIDVAREVGDAYGIPWYASLGALLEAREADAVHISSSLASHLPLIREAAIAGKHILVEKPLAETPADGEAALAAAEAAGVVLMAGYQKVVDADVNYVGDLVGSGRLGPIMGVHSVFRISQPSMYRAIGEHPRVPFLPGREHDATDLHVRMLDQSIHHFNVFNTWLPGGLQVDAVGRGGPLWSVAASSSQGVAVSHINAAASGHGEEFWAYFEGGSVHVNVWSPHFAATQGIVEVIERDADRTYRPIVGLRNPYLALLELFKDGVEGRQPWKELILTAIEDLRTVQRVEATWAAKAPGVGGGK
jgi:predicted dehydrogenase